MMNRLALSLLLLVAAASATWQIKLWPQKGSASGSAANPAQRAPQFIGDVLIASPVTAGPVFAVNLSEKALLWGATFADIQQVVAVPEVKAVIVGCSDLTFGYDAVTGKQLWISDTMVPAAGLAPLVYGRHVLFINTGSDGSNSAIPTGVLAIDAMTGKTTYNTVFANQTITQLVAIDSVNAALVNSLGTFIVFEAATGTQKWSLQGNPAITPPLEYITSGEGFVAVANTTDIPNERVLLILEARTGNKVRTLHGVSGVSTYASSAKFQGNFLYLTIAPGNLQAYDLTTGYINWQIGITNLQTNVAATTFYTDKALVLAATPATASETVFLFYDLATGNLTKQLTGIPTTPSGTFSVVNGDLVVPNLQGIVVVNAATGAVVYRNEDMPLLAGTGEIVSYNGDLVFATETVIYGLTLSS